MNIYEFAQTKGISREEFGKLDVEKLGELHSEYLSEVGTKLKDKANKEDLKKIEDAYANAVTKADLKKATEELEELAKKVAGIVDKQKGGARKTLRDIVAAQVKENEGKETKDKKLEVVVKADILFNVAATAAGGNFPSDDANLDSNLLFATALDVGFAQRLSREATLFNKVAASAVPLQIGEALKVTVPYDQTGTPIRVTEAKAKTTVAFKFKQEKKEAEKLPIVFYLSEEFMNRADYLVAEIQNYLFLLLTEVLEELVFDSTSGILSYATTFTTISGLEIEDANEFDALNAVATVMHNDKFMPDTVVMNTVDVAKMFGAKGNDGHYSLANGGSIRLIEGGTRLVIGNKMFDLIEVNGDIIAAGTFAMIDWSKLKFGLGDFISKANPYTFMRDNVVENVIEAPFAVMEPSIYSGCVVSDTFANVISDITPV